MIIKVIGLGNVLMADDGIGVCIIDQLRKMRLPAEVEVIDGGSCGLGLLTFMEGADKVIIVDAMAYEQSPGSVIKFNPQQLKVQEQTKSRYSHYLSLLQTLELASALGYRQEVCIVGIVPDKIELSTCLSSKLQAMLPKIVDSVLEELPVSLNVVMDK